MIRTHAGETSINMTMKDMDSMDMDAHGMMGNMKNMDMMMGTPWFKSFTRGPFLFEVWMTDTVTGLVAAMLLSVALAVMYECVNYSFNIYHLRAERWHTRQNRVIAHVLLSLLRTISFATAYIMMLCAMSFNIWILVSIVVGSGVGHLVGRPVIAKILKKEKKRPSVPAATELLHDFMVSDGYSVNNDKKPTMVNSRNFSSFEAKLLRYKYDDDDT